MYVKCCIIEGQNNRKLFYDIVSINCNNFYLKKKFKLNYNFIKNRYIRGVAVYLKQTSKQTIKVYIDL